MKSDENLVAYLTKCGNVELYSLLKMLQSRLSPSSKRLAQRYNTAEDVPDSDTQPRESLCNEMVALLRWYGSNSIAYAGRKLIKEEPGCHYHNILQDVAKKINRNQKRKDRRELPKVESVEGWESIICELLIRGAIKGKTVEDILEIFKEAGLETEAIKDAVKQHGPYAIAGGSLPVLVNFLGKKTVTQLIEQIIFQYTYKKVGQEAACQLAKRIIGRLPQYKWRILFGKLGVAILAVDVIRFASSPASRITMPVVSTISALRTLDRLKAEDVKEIAEEEKHKAQIDTNKNLITAREGLIDDSHWSEHLDSYPTELLSDIRRQLQSSVDGLAEKFNTQSRYFGYAGAGGSDVLYIYVQKQGLRIDLNIDRKQEDELKQSGFTVNYVNNYQGRAGWLTGWQIPHDTDKSELVKQWIRKAFE